MYLHRYHHYLHQQEELLNRLLQRHHRHRHQHYQEDQDCQGEDHQHRPYYLEEGLLEECFHYHHL